MLLYLAAGLLPWRAMRRMDGSGSPWQALSDVDVSLSPVRVSNSYSGRAFGGD